MNTKLTAKELDMQYGREQLCEYYLTQGQTIYTILRSVSSSGMSRNISLVAVCEGQLCDITYYAAAALGWKLTDTNGRRAIRVQGAGMDMGFHLVDSLSYALYGEGYKLKHEWL